MKLPKYMEIVADKSSRKPTVSFSVRIKRWGIPIILFNAMRKFEGIKWYHWLIVYPKVCVKAMIRGVV